MKTREWMADFAVKWAKDDSHGYTNDYPSNQWWQDKLNNDCGSFMSLCLHEALLQIGIDTGYNYFEPMGSRVPWNEPFLLRYCDRYDYQSERNQVGDILTNDGHTEMVTSVDPDYLTGARSDRDGKSGDSSGLEVATSRLYGQWNFIYRIKDEYNKEIGGTGHLPQKEATKDQKVSKQEVEMIDCFCNSIVLKKGCKNPEAVKILQRFLSKYEWYFGQVDGDFGPLTDESVRNWQYAAFKGDMDYVDGIIGPKSWALIRPY